MAVPPIIPWEPCNFPDEIQAELNRRRVNRSFRYVDGAKGGWGSNDSNVAEWTKYRGPMSPWVRLCSNGYGREKNANGTPLSSDKIKPGFVMFGGKGFYSEYGFNKNASSNLENQSIIGYMPNGITPHFIENDLKTSNYPIHVPVPEIEKISVTIQKELYRRASIEWVCFSKAQLEYMTPYFLVPGISCILEFGWNLFNPECLVDLNDINQLKTYDVNPYPLYTQHILPSKGNYDVLFGIITHFEWSMEGTKIKCKTEITSKDRIYSGLVVDSKAEIQTEDASGNASDPKPLGSLIECINNIMPQFRNVATDPNPLKIPLLGDYITYIKQHHKDNWEEYIYGIFYGRDPDDLKKTDDYDNKKEDFDRQSQNKDLWLNLGLVMECINYCCSPLKTPGNSEIFRIDIDDVVINAHPNLISCDGSVLLIPNSLAPKYFNGQYAITNKMDQINTHVNAQIEKKRSELLELKKQAADANNLGEFKRLSNVISNLSKETIILTAQESDSLLNGDYDVMRNASVISDAVDYNTAKKRGTLADYKVKTTCHPTGKKIYRDNLDELINKVRYENTVQGQGDNAFPFAKPFAPVKGSKPYPAKYTGLLRDLYVNVNYLKSLVGGDGIKTYYQLIEKMMADISDAAGGFWDFRIVSGTGSQTQPSGEPASMKVVDYKFVNTANRGTPFTFDYFDADSLLLGLNFKPTLSNAQAIRTLYAPTNQPDANVTLTNGSNELLDYQFRDRLKLDTDAKTAAPPAQPDTQHAETMRDLQQISPTAHSYQITSRSNPTRQLITTGRTAGNYKTVPGQLLIRRLVLPSPEILKMLLDDGDEENNPKYTGIMPNIQATFTIQGIGGLRTFMMFLVRNLPEPYSEQNIIFRIVDITDNIEAGKWTTTITAGIIPLRDYIKQRLGIPSKSS